MFNIVLMTLFACGESKDTDSADPTDTAVEPSNEAAGEPSGEDTSTNVETFEISGEVMLASGEPAAGAKIQVCAALCRRTDVMEDGSWALTGVEAEHYIVLGFFQGDGSIATTATLIHLTEDRNLSPMTLHPYATQEDFVSGAHTYTLDMGLQLSVNSDDISAGIYSIGSTSKISSVKVDPSNVPNDMDSANILHMWMMGDYDHMASSGMTISLTEGLDVADGTNVELMYIDNEAHEWKSLGSFVVNGGDPGIQDVELPVLSSLILVQSEG